MPVEDVSQFETRLRSRLDELNERLSEVEAELDQPADSDAEERATEREGDEVLEGHGNAGLLEIRMIQAARPPGRGGESGFLIETNQKSSLNNNFLSKDDDI